MTKCFKVILPILFCLLVGTFWRILRTDKTNQWVYEKMSLDKEVYVEHFLLSNDIQELIWNTTFTLPHTEGLIRPSQEGILFEITSNTKPLWLTFSNVDRMRFEIVLYNPILDKVLPLTSLWHQEDVFYGSGEDVTVILTNDNPTLLPETIENNYYIYTLAGRLFYYDWWTKYIIRMLWVAKDQNQEIKFHTKYWE